MNRRRRLTSLLCWGLLCGLATAVSSAQALQDPWSRVPSSRPRPLNTPPPPPGATAGLSVRERIERVRTQLQTLGYRETSSVAIYELPAGRSIEVPLRVEDGWCFAFASFAGPGAIDTDLLLQGENRRRISADTRVDPDALLRELCLARGNYTLRATMYSGSGPLHLLSMSRRVTTAPLAPWSGPQELDTVLVPLPPQNSQWTPPPMQPWSPTPSVSAEEERPFRQLAHTLETLGYHANGAVVSLAPTGTTATQTLSLDAGRCYAVGLATLASAASEPEFTAELSTPSGNTLATATAREGVSVLRVCVPATGAHQLRVRNLSTTLRVGLFRR